MKRFSLAYVRSGLMVLGAACIVGLSNGDAPGAWSWLVSIVLLLWPCGEFILAARKRPE